LFAIAAMPQPVTNLEVQIVHFTVLVFFLFCKWTFSCHSSVGGTENDGHENDGRKAWNCKRWNCKIWK